MKTAPIGNVSTDWPSTRETLWVEMLRLESFWGEIHGWKNAIWGFLGHLLFTSEMKSQENVEIKFQTEIFGFSTWMGLFTSDVKWYLLFSNWFFRVFFYFSGFFIKFKFSMTFFLWGRLCEQTPKLFQSKISLFFKN